MPGAQGFVQGYNAQAAVDADTMLVLAATVSQEANDKQLVEPIPEELGALPETLGSPEVLLADNGYFSQANVEACVAQEITPLIAAGRESHHLPLAERLAVDQAPPETADPVIKMVHELKTRKGRVAESNRLRLERALYGRRKCTVEPVFGIIKQVMGFRQFSLRGLKAVSGEWKLVTMAFNLKRMHVLAAT